MASALNLVIKPVVLYFESKRGSQLRCRFLRNTTSPIKSTVVPAAYVHGGSDPERLRLLNKTTWPLCLRVLLAFFGKGRSFQAGESFPAQRFQRASHEQMTAVVAPLLSLVLAKVPDRTPSEHSNPTTKIGSQMGGEFTYPKKVSIGFHPRPSSLSDARLSA